ncbi:MAG: organoarsenical effux MFS transporter ArsJ [Candidatus Thiodiazotropha sp.]|nr:organoarsenical effux MFS transporter ArsJ [Candidatus Thiodiazotropha sp.]MCM8884036.1 organoarsenical effux MFS transporter ArsJ [Candidatus Thiodiazotropha sp.]MCM8919697.1 organoarsenical effux MFS transporter ArsJ [Candidatus Thiodiazotropha sp.]MCU7875032.1 organoarsenical effux MFS transporter ArsJ [Candidatus Thiodiazotropha sp. (ex Lucinoma borealis)]
MDQGLRNYMVVTGGYWAFTITDGAIRMLVVLYFHLLGYSPFEVAMLFLFYEFFGIVTNLVGGWLGARIGLNLTMHIGMGLQVVALSALTVPDLWLSVPYVMFAQALSGIAKDLNKMSAKASVKTMVSEGGESKLFKWVAVLTGSKNALKGGGYFIGALLLELIGFRGALAVLAVMLLLVLIVTALLLPSGLGKMKSKPKFSEVFSRVAAINWLSAARFFLFGSRDVWFVVGLPVFLYEVLGWTFTQVGGFLALWIIGYGFVQASVPKLVRRTHHGRGPGGSTARLWAFLLALFPAAIAIGLQLGWPADRVLVIGLILFGIVFAINSAVHSYLILAYSDHEKVAMNVGFYYMANAGGRLIGTILSGLIYQFYGLAGCLWWSAGFVLLAAVLSFGLPELQKEAVAEE